MDASQLYDVIYSKFMETRRDLTECIKHVESLQDEILDIHEENNSQPRVRKIVNITELNIRLHMVSLLLDEVGDFVECEKNFI